MKEDDDKIKSNVISMENFLNTVKEGKVPDQDARLVFLIETCDRAGTMLHKTIELRDISNGTEFANTVIKERALVSKVTQMILATNEIMENHPNAILPEHIERLIDVTPPLDEECKQDMIDTLTATGDIEEFMSGMGSINDKK